MATYEHFQQAKKSESVPDGHHVSACLTCTHWDAPTPRMEAMTREVALCLFRDLRRYGLLVNGSSACNQWNGHPEAGADANAYAARDQ